jgi:predicted alpha/beta hydrolase
MVGGAPAAPRAAAPFEAVCADGWRLRGEVLAPPAPRAVAVVGHAMMVDRRTLDRPPGGGLVSHLVTRGIAVVVADLRGHGASGPTAAEGGRWGYDDLVEGDVPALLAVARARFPSLPCAAVGHSLFGHVALAHAARHPEAPIAALALLAANIFHRAWRARPLAFVAKAGLIELAALLARGGTFPARRLRLGSYDEPRPYLDDFVRWHRQGEWRSRDGFSYEAALPRVRVPVLSLASAGDRLYAPPAEARSLVAPLPAACFVEVGRAHGLAIDPSHMGMVLDARARPVWERLARFLLSALDPTSSE